MKQSDVLNNFQQACPSITGIMACDPRGVIAYQHRLPWHYPSDIKFYRDTIAGQIVIMGATTYQELNATFLASHYCIVFSKKTSLKPPPHGAIVNDATALNALTNVPLDKQCYLIGGAKIAEFFIAENWLDDFLLTEIIHCYPGDTFFNKELLATWPKHCLQQTPDYVINHYINPKGRR
jgi:dihydrofolate reductase